MHVRDLGEFGLIERLRAQLTPPPPDLILGPGDDAAAWLEHDRCALATTDTLVAGVHFLPEWVSAADIGWKALAVNVSDIAAMGGSPSHALITLCLPPETPVAWVDGLYTGLLDCAEMYGVSVAGGDIVSSAVLTVTISLYGWAPIVGGAPAILRRDRARAGQEITVTGPLGGSAGGLRVLRRGDPRDETERGLVRRHMRPLPRANLGAVAYAAGIRCAIDISDGLVQDLGRICRSSGVAAEIAIELVPVDPSLSGCDRNEARMLALTGGEDYELILVGGVSSFERWYFESPSPPETIGSIVEDPEHRVRVLDHSGNEIAIEHAGWDHLRDARDR